MGGGGEQKSKNYRGGGDHDRNQENTIKILERILLWFLCLCFSGCLVPDVHEGEHENKEDTRMNYVVVELASGCCCSSST